MKYTYSELFLYRGDEEKIVEEAQTNFALALADKMFPYIKVFVEKNGPACVVNCELDMDTFVDCNKFTAELRGESSVDFGLKRGDLNNANITDVDFDRNNMSWIFRTDSKNIYSVIIKRYLENKKEE